MDADVTYTLTSHAKHQIEKRKITQDEIAAALAGRVTETNTRTFYYDNSSKVTVVVSGKEIVTVYRMFGKNIKKRLSR